MGITTAKMNAIKEAKDKKEAFEAEVETLRKQYYSLPFGHADRPMILRDINWKTTRIGFYKGVIARLQAGGKYLGDAETTARVTEATTNRKYN